MRELMIRGAIKNGLIDFEKEYLMDYPSNSKKLLQRIKTQFCSFNIFDNVRKDILEYSKNKSIDLIFDPRYIFSNASICFFRDSLDFSIIFPKLIGEHPYDYQKLLMLSGYIRDFAEAEGLKLGIIREKLLRDQVIKDVISNLQAGLSNKNYLKQPSRLLASVVLAIFFKILNTTIFEVSKRIDTTENVAFSVYINLKSILINFTSRFIELRCNNISNVDFEGREVFRATYRNPELLPIEHREELFGLLEKISIKQNFNAHVRNISYLILRYLDMKQDLEFLLVCCLNLIDSTISKDKLLLITQVMDQVIVEKTHSVEDGKKIFEKLGFIYEWTDESFKKKDIFIDLLKLIQEEKIIKERLIDIWIRWK